MNEFSDRRKRLIATMGGGAIIFASNPLAVHHKDVDYNYRQESELYYFTGFTEPETIAVIIPGHPEHQFVMFVRPKNEDQEIWTGYRAGVEGAKEIYGADAAYSIEELDNYLPQYLEKADTLYYSFGHHEGFNQKILHHYRRLLASYPKRGTGPTKIVDNSIVTATQRQYKTPYEIEQIRKAIGISVAAHEHVQAVAQSGTWEYELEAILEGDFRKSGADGAAYPSIVASGANACILHYVNNNCQLSEGDLVLVDAGCSFNYYNADITRTFAVGGKFSTEQGLLYEIVLQAQKNAIGAVKPGNTINDVHETALKTIVAGLLSLGLLKGPIEEIITQKAYKPFFMHGTSHWLGIDVHDIGMYKNGETWTQLQPQMLITVEPGIYISDRTKPAENQPEIPDRWRGIGIRIEDDILVTETGHEVLTSALAK